jgi:hypothetical protein
MSELHSTFTLSLFLGTAALFFASATHDAVGTGKGAGSAVLEKEEAIQSGKPGRSLSNSPREARRTKVGRSDGTMKQRERERERERADDRPLSARRSRRTLSGGSRCVGSSRLPKLQALRLSDWELLKIDTSTRLPLLASVTRLSTKPVIIYVMVRLPSALTRSRPTPVYRRSRRADPPNDPPLSSDHRATTGRLRMVRACGKGRANTLTAG